MIAIAAVMFVAACSVAFIVYAETQQRADRLSDRRVVVEIGRRAHRLREKYRFESGRSLASNESSRHRALAEADDDDIFEPDEFKTAA